MKECPFRYSFCGKQHGIKCPDNVWCNKQVTPLTLRRFSKV